MFLSHRSLWFLIGFNPNSFLRSHICSAKCILLACLNCRISTSRDSFIDLSLSSLPLRYFISSFNSAKVSNFCADVIGDICGVLSGAISAVIVLKMTEYYGFSENLQFIMSAIVASLTVGGKAFTKGLAKKNSTKIEYKSFLKGLLNNGITYLLDENYYDLPPIRRRYSGEFEIDRILENTLS